MCGACAVRTSPSPEAARKNIEVLERVSGRRFLGRPAARRADAELLARAAGAVAAGGSRFVATPSGAVLDTAPPPPPAAAAAADSAASRQARWQAAAPTAPAALAGSEERPVPRRCPRGTGGCEVCWTERPRQFGYYCSGCGDLQKGARWQCAAHLADLCTACRPAPDPTRATVAREDGAGGIDERSWRAPSAAPALAGACEDVLGTMLAEQEWIIQGRSLDEREAREAREAARPGASAGAGRRAAEAPAAEPPAAPRADPQASPAELDDGSLMDENAARARPRWAEEGLGPAMRAGARPVPLERSFDLTLTLTGDLVEELARGYAQPWFQELVRDCARRCGYDRTRFLTELQDVAFEVQRPILENWGFDLDEQDKLILP